MLDKTKLYVGQTVFYNTRAARGVQLSYIGKILKLNDDNSDYPIVLLKNRHTAFPAFYGKLSEIPTFKLANIATSEIQAYKDTEITEEAIVGNNYLKSAEERLNQHYNRARYRDYRRGY